MFVTPIQANETRKERCCCCGEVENVVREGFGFLEDLRSRELR